MNALATDSVPVMSATAAAWLAGPGKKMLIDGAWVAALSGETFDTCDPATGKLLARVPLGERGRCGCCSGGRAAGLRRGAVAQHDARRAGQDSVAGRRSHGRPHR